nr:formin-like protein 14 [Lolium perenne]
MSDCAALAMATASWMSCFSAAMTRVLGDRRHDRVDFEGTVLLARFVLGLVGEDDVGGILRQRHCRSAGTAGWTGPALPPPIVWHHARPSASPRLPPPALPPLVTLRASHAHASRDAARRPLISPRDFPTSSPPARHLQPPHARPWRSIPGHHARPASTLPQSKPPTTSSPPSITGAQHQQVPPRNASAFPTTTSAHASAPRSAQANSSSTRASLHITAPAVQVSEPSSTAGTSITALPPSAVRHCRSTQPGTAGLCVVLFKFRPVLAHIFAPNFDNFPVPV